MGLAKKEARINAAAAAEVARRDADERAKQQARSKAHDEALARREAEYRQLTAERRRQRP